MLVQQCSNQLSYQDLYIGSRPICWVHLNPWKEWNTEWWCELRKYKFNWRHEWYLQLNSNFRSSHHHSLIHQFNWSYERYLQLNLYFRSSHHHSVFHRNNCQTCTTWASNITLTPSGNKLPNKRNLLAVTSIPVNEFKGILTEYSSPERLTQMLSVLWILHTKTSRKFSSSGIWTFSKRQKILQFGLKIMYHTDNKTALLESWITFTTHLW